MARVAAFDRQCSRGKPALGRGGSGMGRQRGISDRWPLAVGFGRPLGRRRTHESGRGKVGAAFIPRPRSGLFWSALTPGYPRFVGAAPLTPHSFSRSGKRGRKKARALPGFFPAQVAGTGFEPATSRL